MTKGRPQTDYGAVQEQIIKQGYVNYLTCTGKELHIFPVPINVVRGVKFDKPKPPRPSVEMEIVGGKTQKRWMKAGDPGWENYQEELKEWSSGKNELQDAVALCLALKDFSFPKELEFPDSILELVDLELLEIPDNIYLKRVMWLECAGYIGQNDTLEIDWILQQLSGVPEEVIDNMKESFRNLLLGKNIGGVVEDTPNTNGGSD